MSQNPWLINESVKNNILIGSDEDMEQLGRVLEVCELASEVTLDQQVGVNGSHLSGG